MPTSATSTAGSSTGENYYISTTKQKADAAAAQQVADKSRVTHDEFLKLLTAQLTHQDPLKPMEDIQFTSQLAQLQALDEQVQMTKSMEGMRLDSQLKAGSELIGQYVAGTDEAGISISGLVTSVSVKDGQADLILHDGTRLSYANVTEIKVAMGNL
jgi:flagellar basal-body rod modification protein FlgD